MNIIEIYEKYFIPENLQLHMLRVAACSSLILEHWTGNNIEKESIIRVLLLHDMGNIVKIPESIEQNKNFILTRRKYIQKYGENDHAINLEIAKNEGLNEKELTILDGKRSRYNEQTLNSNSYEIKICAYCDQRVAPDGVVGIKERLENAKKRYKNKPLSIWANEEKSEHLIACALGIESQIMKFCSIRPEDINNINWDL